jgi:AraC-like DNA-binding protein
MVVALLVGRPLNLSHLLPKCIHCTPMQLQLHLQRRPWANPSTPGLKSAHTVRAIVVSVAALTSQAMLTGHTPLPTTPISYVRLLLILCAEHGVPYAPVLDGLGITDDQLQDPDARVSLRPVFAELCRRSLALTGEPALGYLFGLRAHLTTHGILGYGLMSQPSLRQVLSFGQQFGTVLRLSAWDLHVQVGDTHARMWAVDSIPPNDIREFSAQVLIVSAYSMLAQLLPACTNDVVLCFDFPEPAYHRAWAHRLPTCRFGAAFNEIRLPLRYIDMSLHTANPMSALLAERECSRELSQLDAPRHDDVTRQVRKLLTLQADQGYPTPAAIAQQLHVSLRTLARQLQTQGSSYRTLLQEARKRDSRFLLQDTRLSTADIAVRLGYESLPGFTRAFQAWYGLTPQAFRLSQPT